MIQILPIDVSKFYTMDNFCRGLHYLVGQRVLNLLKLSVLMRASIKTNYSEHPKTGTANTRHIQKPQKFVSSFWMATTKWQRFKNRT